jgi:hypothetical protein
MIKIFADDKVTLLHMIFKKEDREDGRIDIAPENQFIQVSSLNLKRGKTFRPHRHIWKQSELSVIAQESWCIIKGKVLASFYNKDDILIDKYELNEGDISLTFEGGHTYEILEDAEIFEYKTGPYTGIDNDKLFL